MRSPFRSAWVLGLSFVLFLPAGPFEQASPDSANGNPRGLSGSVEMHVAADGASTAADLQRTSLARSTFGREAGLRNIRKVLERELGMKVGLNVIEAGGLFDKPTFVAVRGSERWI